MCFLSWTTCYCVGSLFVKGSLWTSITSCDKGAFKWVWNNTVISYSLVFLFFISLKILNLLPISYLYYHKTWRVLFLWFLVVFDCCSGLFPWVCCFMSEFIQSMLDLGLHPGLSTPILSPFEDIYTCFCQVSWTTSYINFSDWNVLELTDSVTARHELVEGRGSYLWTYNMGNFKKLTCFR